MSDYPRNPGNKPRRLRDRVSYDRPLVHSILDEALICHVGFDSDGPLVLPMIHARVGEDLYLHASTGAGLAVGGLPRPVSVTATVVDGLVLAKSWFHHSLNYRSVVIRGEATTVVDEQERMTALRAVMEHISPGRSEASRPPDGRELAATTVIRVSLDSVAAKVREGGPSDDPDDAGLPHWSGVVPVHLVAGPAEPHPGEQPAAPPPRDPRLGS